MWEILETYWVQLLIGYYPDGPLGGLAMTLILASVGLVLALPAGLTVCLGLISPWRPRARAVELFVLYMRSVPLIVHLLWIYFLLPLVIKGAPLWLVVLVVITLFNGAYMSQTCTGAPGAGIAVGWPALMVSRESTGPSCAGSVG